MFFIVFCIGFHCFHLFLQFFLIVMCISFFRCFLIVLCWFFYVFFLSSLVFDCYFLGVGMVFLIAFNDKSLLLLALREELVKMVWLGLA